MSTLPRLISTGIEYLDMVWNFYSGCKNPKTVCEVLEDCWARGTVERFPDHYPNGFEPTFYPEAFLSPLRRKKPTRIGVAFMGDLFGDWIEPQMIVRPVNGHGRVFCRDTLRNLLFTVILDTSQHTYLFLTKCGWNLNKWSPFPMNCQVGITATNTMQFVAALGHLRGIEAGALYISIEPFYQWDINLTEKLLMEAKNSGVTWIIIGCQTKPYRVPLLPWVKAIVETCVKLEINVFLKDNLRPFLPHETPYYKLILPYSLPYGIPSVTNVKKGDWQLRQEIV